MKQMLGFLLLVWTVSGCSSATSSPTIDEVRAAQARSEAGPTNKWPVADAEWSKATEDMRDRAYRFCSIRRPKNTRCLAEQDYSLISANHAESSVSAILTSPDDEYPYFKAIRERPTSFSDARAFCLQIYEDSGAADARMLGPCLLNAIGGDYFGIVPVS